MLTTEPADAIAIPRERPNIVIHDCEIDDIHNAISEYVERHAEPYITEIDGFRVATFKRFRFVLETVDCEAVLNYVRNSMEHAGLPLPWEAHRVSHSDDQLTDGAELRQRIVYHAEGV